MSIDKFFVINNQNQVLVFLKQEDERMRVAFPTKKYLRKKTRSKSFYKVLLNAGVIRKDNTELLFEVEKEYTRCECINGKLEEKRRQKRKRYYFVLEDLKEDVLCQLNEIGDRFGFVLSFVPVDMLPQMIEESEKESNENYNKDPGIIEATKELKYKMKENIKC